jgi:signal transduction histidine kinase
MRRALHDPYMVPSMADGPRMNIDTARIRKTLCASIPTSRYLEHHEWLQRHYAVVAGYLVGIALVIAVGVARGFDGYDIAHNMSEWVLLLAPAIGLLVFKGRSTAQLLASTGLLVACTMLVHYTDGLIESHFSFFVMLPLVALYMDWRPFVFSVAFVAISHGVVGIVDPTSMYNHPAALAAPIKWGVVHALYVLALSLIMLIHWNFSDRRRLELKAALRDLRVAQSQLVEAQKLESIGSLAAGVAHEINTPIQFVGDNLEFISDAAEGIEVFMTSWFGVRSVLAGRAGCADLVAKLDAIAEETDLEFLLAEIPEAVAQSLEGVHRVANIVKAMKGFSHPNDEITASDINQLITDTATVARNEWKYVAELRLDLMADLPLVPVPPGSFNQMVLNLIVNAAHAIAERGDEAVPGLITVATRCEGGQVTISVGDNGCGIPDDIRNRMYEQFFTTKEVGRGTGQGLSIARSVVEGIGGEISVETEVGTGSIFTVAIPLAQSEELAHARA